HSFKMIKSPTTLVEWSCQRCYSYPHSWIFECQYCKFYMCGSCFWGSLIEPGLEDGGECGMTKQLVIIRR
ncbi:hypothetical protein QBC37DRAFT_301439, partial [Rhypophila decipiens]